MANNSKAKAATLAMAKHVWIKLKGNLNELVQQYCKLMIEQDVHTLKQMHLPAFFSPTHMSALWQLLKGWVAKASPGLKAKLEQIKRMNGTHSGGKTKAQMEILNLALVQKDKW